MWYKRANPEDFRYNTGQPASFPYLRNNEKAPRPPKHEDRFQQKIEPHGRFMIEDETPGSPLPPNWERGKVEFKKPLVLEWNANPEGGYDATSWKAVLSKMYGGKRGKALAAAIKADGYDAVITTKMFNGKRITSEVVDLTGP